MAARVTAFLAGPFDVAAAASIVDGTLGYPRIAAIPPIS